MGRWVRLLDGGQLSASPSVNDPTWHPHSHGQSHHALTAFCGSTPSSRAGRHGFNYHRSSLKQLIVTFFLHAEMEGRSNTKTHVLVPVPGP